MSCTAARKGKHAAMTPEQLGLRAQAMTIEALVGRVTTLETHLAILEKGGPSPRVAPALTDELPTEAAPATAGGKAPATAGGKAPLIYKSKYPKDLSFYMNELYEKAGEPPPAEAGVPPRRREPTEVAPAATRGKAPEGTQNEPSEGLLARAAHFEAMHPESPSYHVEQLRKNTPPAPVFEFDENATVARRPRRHSDEVINKAIADHLGTALATVSSDAIVSAEPAAEPAAAASSEAAATELSAEELAANEDEWMARYEPGEYGQPEKIAEVLSWLKEKQEKDASVTMSHDPDDFDKYFTPEYSRPEQMAEYRKITQELLGGAAPAAAVAPAAAAAVAADNGAGPSSANGDASNASIAAWYAANFKPNYEMHARAAALYD